MFINDIVGFIGIPYLLFADDIKLFLEVNSTSDCVMLQRFLDSVLSGALLTRWQ